MQVNIPFGALGSRGMSSGGGVLTTPLYLPAGEATSALEAVTKQYVDDKISSINADSISEGTLGTGLFPAFTGDAVSNAGSGFINLSGIGITAGTYTKISVNTKGRVISTGNISSEDIPSIGWGKITSDKPTTLSGYGITDALGKVGGVVTGEVTTTVVPTQTLHAVNKSYVDAALTNASSLATGDILRSANSVTPTGFLKCNGSELVKTDYPALYAVVGDMNSFDLQPGSGQPWRQQYVINTEQSGDITGWTTGTALPLRLAYSQAVVTKNRVYLLGGYNNSIYVSTIYTAPVNPDGTLGGWVTGTALPGSLGHSQVVVTKNRVYLLGGYSNDRIFVSTVCTAPINSDGTLGSWTTGTALPVALGHSQAVVTKNRVYLLGGESSGGYVSTVYTAPINSDGTLGTWTTGTALPGALVYSQAVVTKNRVYLLGGIDNGSYVSTVYTAPILGGLNDYSPYYDGTIISTKDPLKFALPDYTSKQTNNLYYYIKT